MKNRRSLTLLLATFTALSAGCTGDPVPPGAARPDVPTDRGAADELPGDAPGVADVAAPDDAVVAAPDAADATDAQPAPDAPAPTCGDTRFVRPTADAVLGIADDSDRDCANGFTADVQVSTNAPAGTALVLEVGGRTAGTATVAGSTVTFSNVMLDTGGMQTLQVRAAGVASPCAAENVTVRCNLPRCQITAPARSTLSEADNASPGMPFTADFTVGTDVEDGREVELFLSNATSPLRAAVVGGAALFRGVGLSPDGTYRARAVCTDRSGNTGMSAESPFVVDATAPTLIVARPTSATTVGVSADSNEAAPGVQFQVCGRSSEAGQSFCAAEAGATPTCATVASVAAETCVELTCPTGDAPFAVEVTARDEAGNVARTTVRDVRCHSTLPSVRVVAPAAYDPADRATVLNATRDADPATRGLQADVVACTDRAGGIATLTFNGEDAAPASPTADVTPTTTGDPCAALGLGFVGIARFPRATLPESVADPAGAEPTGPTLQVAVTDDGDTGRSSALRLYVDSVPPAVSVVSCGLVVTPATDGTGTTDIDVASDAYPVTLTLAPAGSMPTSLTLLAPSAPTGRGRFLAVRFPRGITSLSAAATDAAGNASATNAPCTVEVGNPPTLAFVSPTPGQAFSASAAATVTLRSDAPVGTAVSLTVGASPAVTSPVAAGGMVTFPGVTLPQGDAVVLDAVTASVPGRGVAHASVTVAVDTEAPSAPGSFAVAVPATPASARRAGTVRLSWLDAADPAPGGGARAVARYELRYGTVPIDASNFSLAIPLTPTAPGAPGSANHADATGLRLGRPYYFAMRALDRGGLAGPVVGTSTPLSIDLVREAVSDAPVALGGDVSGGFDVNGDSFADVVVATGSTSGAWAGVARIYFGSATGLSSTRYTEFRGNAGNRFGATVASLGDVNGDGLGDVAIAEPGPLAATSLGPGAVYVFFGRRTWNPATTPYVAANANVTLGGGTGEFATASLGFAVARAGDFNGDGLNDIAASAPQSATRGAVLVVFGRATLPATLAPSAADVIIRNSTTDTLFGRTLVGVGRVVGNDSLDDLAVGYGLTSVPAAAALFAGRAPATPLALTLVDAAFTRAGLVTAANNRGQFAVAGPGDLDGDGRADFAVGTTGRGPGSVALYFGNPAGGLTEGPTVDSTLPSTAEADVFGTRVATIPSGGLHPSLLVPSPTGADLLIGSNGYNGSDPRLHVFSGRASWTGLNANLAEQQVPFTGAATQPLSATTWVGDVDGDGYPDAAIARSAGEGTVVILR